jgi:hypothetical protein
MCFSQRVVSGPLLVLEFYFDTTRTGISFITRLLIFCFLSVTKLYNQVSDEEDEFWESVTIAHKMGGTAIICTG